MQKRLVLLASYLLLLPCVVLSLVLSLFFLHASYAPTQTIALKPVKTDKIAVVNPARIVAIDPRIEALNNFFGRYGSPLTPYAQAIVSAADKYELDWRLVPAIAMQESTLCQKAPKNSYNCWGYGVYGGKVMRFTDYGEAIETVTRVLAHKYKANGLEFPHEIVTRYTPGNDGTWATNVSYVMDRIQSSL